MSASLGVGVGIGPVSIGASGSVRTTSTDVTANREEPFSVGVEPVSQGGEARLGAVAYEHAHRATAREQKGEQPPADETGRPGDEVIHRAPRIDPHVVDVQ